MSTLGINRLVDGVLTSADTATLGITNSLGVTVLVTTLVAPTSIGVYSYDVSDLVPGDYTATWTFSVTGLADDEVNRPFTIDSPVAITQGVTLAELERALARRLGPFHHLRTSDTGSSTDAVAIKKLRSSLTLGDFEEMYLLRRGVLNSGALVTNFAEDDRQRLVETYTPLTGVLEPDYPWEVAPLPNEMIELHALDPEEELRYALQDGLRRCYFWDTLTVSSTGYQREIDVTTLAPWLTRKEQIRRVQYGRAGYLPYSSPWFDTSQSGGSVLLQTTAPTVGNLRVHVLRPVSSLVNGELSMVGPDSDNDVLYVDREYALLAGHVQAWWNFPHRLADIAVAHRTADQKDVVSAFTNRSRTVVGNIPEFIQNRFDIGDGYQDDLQVGNV